MKSNTFEEVQNAYGLKTLQPLKSVITCWLSHGRAAERVLEHYEPLIAALDKIYLREKEPAVRQVILLNKNTVTQACEAIPIDCHAI